MANFRIVLRAEIYRLIWINLCLVVCQKMNWEFNWIWTNCLSVGKFMKCRKYSRWLSKPLSLIECNSREMQPSERKRGAAQKLFPRFPKTSNDAKHSLSARNIERGLAKHCSETICSLRRFHPLRARISVPVGLGVSKNVDVWRPSVNQSVVLGI